MQQIIFIVLSVTIIGSALFVVTTRNLFHAALMLMLAFFGVAGYYVLLDIGFFAVAQVLVYIGAISILFIFAVMLTRGMMGMPRNNAQAQGAAFLCIGIFIAMALILSPNPLSVQLGNFEPRIIGGVPWDYSTLPVIPDTVIGQLGRDLTDPEGFALPFELASVLILLAMVGAIWVARERRSNEILAERALTASEDAEDRAIEEGMQRQSAIPAIPEGAAAASAESH